MFSTKNIGHILKNKQKNKFICIHENEDENEKRSHRYDINRHNMDIGILNIKSVSV